MKIIYSPEYDNDRLQMLTPGNDCMLDVMYAGNAALLDQLQLRTGMTSVSISDAEREVAYMLALRKHTEGSVLKFADSSDEIGDARCLLQWRDCLIMAGWTPEMRGISPKIDDLAAVDDDFCAMGRADEWLEMKAFLTENRGNCLEGIEIAADTRARFVPKLIRDTLKGAVSNGAEVSYAENAECAAREGSDLRLLQNFVSGKTDSGSFCNDGSVKVMPFKDKCDSMEWFADRKNAENAVAVNRDAMLMNNLLGSWNKPLVQAEAKNCNPQITQLFKLGLSLFVRPLNIYNLLSYLQMPVHPLDRMLRNKLANAINNEGGINKAWHDSIDNYVFDEDTRKNNARRKKLCVFWEAAECSDEDVSRERITAFNNALAAWADRMMHSDAADEMTRRQLGILKDFCKAFDLAAANTDELNGEALKCMICGIYRPCSIVQQCAQKGAVPCVSCMGGIKHVCNEIVWLDCNAGDLPAYDYEFVNSGEKMALAEMGAEVPSPEDVLMGERFAMIRGLCRAKESLVVVSALYDGNKRTEVHPFLLELQMLMGKKTADYQNSHMKVTSGKTDVRLPEKEYSIEKMELPMRQQSYNSIQKLINFPFDYFTEYVLGFYNPDKSSDLDIKRIKGYVAHLFVQNLIDDGKNDVKTIRNLYENEFDVRFDNAVREKGALLLLLEYTAEKEQFKEKLRKSAGVLIEIMEKKNLKPYGCEVAVEAEDFYGLGELKANIDCLLTNDEGHYVILDFKWSENKSYQEKIKDNRSLQLALYRWAVEHGKNLNGTVDATGYYLFPQCCLYTSYFADDGDMIKHVDPSGSYEDLIVKIKNGASYRKMQIEDGCLEEGEGFNLNDITYCNEAECKNMLQVDSNDNKTKTSPYVAGQSSWENAKSLLEKPTTHPILKARLK